MKRTRLWRILNVVLLALAALAGGFLVWASMTNPLMPEAEAALLSGPAVTVEQGRWIVFRPVAEEPQTGLIFYPGGRVDPRAYAPAMRALAGEGYLAVIVPMPLNLAVLGIDRASAVMDAFPAVESWAIGGHSLGAAMAAAYSDRYPERIAGLALLAGYPAESNSLADARLPVVSIYGTLDGLATPDKIAASRALLPPDTRFVAVEGGNHAQFGYYGMQSGDNPAVIDHTAQQAQTVSALLGLLIEIAPPER